MVYQNEEASKERSIKRKKHVTRSYASVNIASGIMDTCHYLYYFWLHILLLNFIEHLLNRRMYEERKTTRPTC